jgi:DNA segregation ATPase FtsK/SpoIIIE-like protein
MKINKKIMNPARIKQLQIIQDAGETNVNLVSYRSANKTEQVHLSLQRFAELKLIRFTGGGYFEIAETGTEYLKQLESEGTVILQATVTEYEKEKYEQAVKLIEECQKGEGVSVSMLQRKLRVGYGLGTVILHSLLKNGYVESYEQWVGSSVNGVKKDGDYLKMFKVKG